MTKSTLDLSTRSTLDLATLQAKLKTLQARTPRSSNTERCSNTDERASSRSTRASRCSYTEARTPRCSNAMSNAERCSDTEKEPAAATAHKATYEAGTMVRIGGNNLLMSPPLILTEVDVTKILADLRSGLSAL